MLKIIGNYVATATNSLAALRPLADVIARLYIARVFFLSGLSKIQDWETTLYLFSDEYHVPVLPPKLAAMLGTGGELTFSVLLAIGLLTPISAFGLFVLNIVAFVSYYHALIETPAAWHDHLEWGIIIALLMTAKSGAISIDTLIKRFSPLSPRERGSVNRVI